MASWTAAPGIIELPDGRLVRGRGLRHPMGDQLPEFGVYLLGREPAPFSWESRWVRWSDFRTPRSTADVLAALEDAYQRAASERVEVACRGGIGRTGTALAAMAVLSGVPASEAVDWVRERYHRRAVETPGQKRWVRKRSAGWREES